MFSSTNFLLSPSLLTPSPFSNSPKFSLLKSTLTNNHSPLSLCSAHKPWFVQLAELTATSSDEGPIELPSSSLPAIFATSDDPSALQVATSVLLTGAITVFLFRSLRRRAKRAKEMKFRSSGAKKSLKEEAMESFKTVSLSSVDAKAPPSPVQAFFGAITAGVIALILYKFTTTIEASLNRQTMPDNYQVRQITVTIRTIINGICYLATFVFGINSFGLLLYSGQLAFNSAVEDFSSEGEGQLSSLDSKSNDTENSGITSEDQSSGDVQ